MACDDFVDTAAERVIQNQHLTPRYETIVDENVDWIACELVELDDTSFGQSQYFFDKHFAAPEFDFDVEFDIPQQVDAGNLCGRHCALKVWKIHWHRAGGDGRDAHVRGGCRSRLCGAVDGGIVKSGRGEKLVDRRLIVRCGFAAGCLGNWHRLAAARSFVHLGEQRIDISVGDSALGFVGHRTVLG